MPEIPQIQQTSPLRVPDTVGIQRLNLERPNPALESAEKEGHDIEFQSSFLAASIERQKIANDLLSSDADFINRATDLNNKLSGVQDPDAKYKLQQSGVQDIVSGIIKENPSIAPHIQQNLAVRSQEYLRTSSQEMLLNKHAIGAANLDTAIQKSLVAIGNANSYQDELQIKNNVLQAIEIHAQNGDLTPQEAIKKSLAFNTQSQIAKIDSLIAKNPSAVTSMSSREMGVDPKTGLELQAKAQAAINRQYDADNPISKQNTIDFLQKFDAHQTSVTEDADAINSGIITQRQYESKYHHPYANDGLRNSIINTLENFRGTPTQLRALAAQNIAGNSALTHEDKDSANAYVALVADRVKSEDGQRQLDNLRQLTDFVNTSYPALTASTIAGLGDPYKSQKVQINAIKAYTRASMKNAKTPEDEANLIQKAQQQVIKIMGHEPKAKGGKLPDAISTTVGGPE